MGGAVKPDKLLIGFGAGGDVVKAGESGKLSAQRFNHLRGMTWFEVVTGVNE